MTLQAVTSDFCGAACRLARAARRALSVALGALLACVILSAPATAAAAEPEPTHVFDAALSLTGNCETSKVDPVGDPICPEEAPDGAFSEPLGVTTDAYGDIYYFGRPKQGVPTDVYIFDAHGRFITQVPLYPALTESAISQLAVDGEGHLYVAMSGVASDIGDVNALYVLDPSAYDPVSGKIAYGNAPTEVSPTEVSRGSLSSSAVALDRATNRLFLVAHRNNELVEVGSYAEGNPVLRTFAAGTVKFWHSVNIAVDAGRELLYVTETKGGGQGSISSSSGVNVFDFAGHLLRSVEGGETSAGFEEFTGEPGVAVDEHTGHLFVSRFSEGHTDTVYELDAAGKTVSTLTHNFAETNNYNQIAIDNGVHSPNSSMNPSSPLSEEENPNGSYLFVPSGTSKTGHLFAFGPKRLARPPVVSDEAFVVNGSTEAVLSAKVDPQELATSYRFEYVLQETYARDVEEAGAGHGFDHAVSVGAGALSAGNEAVPVSAPLVGLAPGSAYRFRVVASNLCEGEGAAECVVEGPSLEFATYALPLAAPFACANQALRVSASAVLPDCRAYELVTPADVNGHLTAPGRSTVEGPNFGTPSVSAAGGKVAFLTHGGAAPGLPGGGSVSGDPYVASRGTGGWSSVSVGLSGSQSTNPWSGGFSPDFGYVTLETGQNDTGTLVVEQGENFSAELKTITAYVRYPDGSLHPVGEGSLATDWKAKPWLISADGSHIIFDTSLGPHDVVAPQLEPQAPPTGTGAIYDRTADGVVHVVSLLPGDVTPAAKDEALYQGAAADGSVVAFKLGSDAAPLYVRVDDVATFEVGPAGSTFAGLSSDGRHGFYLAGGDLYRFDSETGGSVRITESGDVTVVNIPSSGTSAYFSSASVLGEPGQEGPNGARPVVGKPNLYYWDGATVRFVATLSEADMKGENTSESLVSTGLGSWVENLRGDSTARDPSRTTPGGGVIAFQSNADLAGYESGGFSEVYRYDASEGTLVCVSCAPTRSTALGPARLQTVATGDVPPPTGLYSEVSSLTAGGGRVFFESPDALVVGDTDGVRDVYEWEADGEGTCVVKGGCVQLISSGQGASDSYLYGVSESGDDVFLYTEDLLTREDNSEAPSVYDARVDGGFVPPTAVAAECLGEACQPEPQALHDLTPASFGFQGAGNVVVRPAVKKKAKPGVARKLAKALKACKRKRRKGPRVRCEARARKRYGHATKSTRARRAGSNGRTVR